MSTCRTCQFISESPVLDTELYSLQGSPERPVTTSAAQFSNEALALAQPVTFTGTLDQWLVIVATQLAAQGGQFVSESQTEANSQAADALASWVAEQTALGTLVTT
jgi:hypothetical protein